MLVVLGGALQCMMTAKLRLLMTDHVLDATGLN